MVDASWLLCPCSNHDSWLVAMVIVLQRKRQQLVEGAAPINLAFTFLSLCSNPICAE